MGNGGGPWCPICDYERKGEETHCPVDNVELVYKDAEGNPIVA